MHLVTSTILYLRGEATIDLQKEKLLSLAEAATLLPTRRNKSRPHPSTLYRWGKHGLNGIRLEVLRIGDTTCTSLPALQRFFDRLTESEFEHSAPKKTQKTANTSSVDEMLDEMGV